MSIHYRASDDYITIMGNTYPHKEAIKALGARFYGPDKVWRLDFSSANEEAVRELCEKLGGGAITTELKRPAASTEAKPDDGLSVRQLMSRVNVAVASAFPKNVWVVGEIQNISKRGSGFFLNLSEPKESSTQSGTISIKATLWSSTLSVLRSLPGREKVEELLEDGLKVRVLCQVSLYQDRGQISLNITDIDPSYTKGELALAREALLKELRQKGLDQLNKQRPLPAFPFRVGLISADNSRAKSDFIHQLTSQGFPGEVIFVHASMQGERTAKDVSRALDQLNQAACDVIVVTRGGGSAADLRWFDHRELALALAQSERPVIAAIGHHDDLSIAEEIAFRREKTPTAAAAFILDVFLKTTQLIDVQASRIGQLLAQKIKWAASEQQQLCDRINDTAQKNLQRRRNHGERLQAQMVYSSRERLSSLEQKLTERSFHLTQEARRAITLRHEHLQQWQTRLVAHDPSPWLAKGWTQLWGTRGRIATVADVAVDDKINIRLQDGTITTKVIAKETRHGKKDRRQAGVGNLSEHAHEC